MRRALFVDDEPRVLEGLQRMLRVLRSEWTCEFATSGPGALEKLAATPFDVVISDMRMPGMDGCALLNRVKAEHPGVVRIILSGQSDREEIVRSVGPTHQYLSKPCDADTLRAALQRACALGDLLASKPLQRLVAQVGSLPSPPGLYTALVDALQKPDTSMADVGQIIARDVAMTAKVLQLVNSAFFGVGRRVSSPQQAATLLGLDILRALVLTVHAFAQYEGRRLPGFSLEALQSHSIAVGALARRIAHAEGCPARACDDALMAGLLHDVGKLVLGAGLTRQYAQAMAVARSYRVPMTQAERRVMGGSHAEVGAYLLGLWGLQGDILAAVAFHHEPRRCLTQGFGPLAAVHIANAIDVASGPSGADQPAWPVDLDYLRELGVTDRIADWAELVPTASESGADR